MYDLRINELQIILDTVKQNKTGSKQSLRKRVLNLLTAPSPKTRALRQKIVQVYRSRSQQNRQLLQQQPLPPLRFQRPQQRFSWQSPSYNPPYINNLIPTFNETPPVPSSEFEHLPFFKQIQTLLTPMYCQTFNNDSASFTGLFHLTDNIRHSIVKSWNIAKQEYKIQITLRLSQVARKENVTERLPYNITVSVNDRQCKLPTLNIPTKAGITPWRCNVPIDLTQQTELRICTQNTLKISWSEEPHEYMAGVFVAQKLTWNELLVDLKKRPVRPSEKTKELIRKSMESDVDMGVDSMFATVKDPLSKTRMELPARGVDCIHMQCFDAIQFLQMNEQKQTWSCPLCKKKVKFENIEVDEFFLNILQSPNLSEECENVILLQDGSWTEKKIKESPNIAKTINDRSSNNIEVFTLDSSDDEDYEPKVKCLKMNLPNVEQSIIKSENIGEPECLSKINEKNSTENNLVLDLSLKNNSSPPSTSSDDQQIFVLSDDPDPPTTIKSSCLLNNYHLPHITITEGSNIDNKPSSSGISKSKKDKDKTRAVLCVITLD